MSEPQPPVASPKRPKFAPATRKRPAAEMAMESTVAMLKNEAKSFKSAGIRGLLDDAGTKVDAQHMMALKFPFLSTSTTQQIDDKTGDSHVLNNSEQYTSFIETYPGFSPRDTTGTVSLNVGVEQPFNLHCDLVNRLQFGPLAADGLPTVFLNKNAEDKPEFKTSKKGGFDKGGYNLVNVSIFNVSMQERCLFGFASIQQFVTQIGPAAKHVSNAVLAEVSKMFPNHNVCSKGVHALFNWNAHSLFSYHQDEKSTVTVIVNLSPAMSDFHVAGRAHSCTYVRPGDTHIFPSAVVHRSGSAERRTVKCAYFFDLKMNSSAEASSSAPTVDEENSDKPDGDKTEAVVAPVPAVEAEAQVKAEAQEVEAEAGAEGKSACAETVSGVEADEAAAV